MTCSDWITEPNEKEMTCKQPFEAHNFQKQKVRVRGLSDLPEAMHSAVCQSKELRQI